MLGAAQEVSLSGQVLDGVMGTLVPSLGFSWTGSR